MILIIFIPFMYVWGANRTSAGMARGNLWKACSQPAQLKDSSVQILRKFKNEWGATFEYGIQFSLIHPWLPLSPLLYLLNILGRKILRTPPSRDRQYSSPPGPPQMDRRAIMPLFTGIVLPGLWTLMSPSLP